MCIGGNGLHPVQPALAKALEEFAPMHFRFGECSADAEYGALAFVVDSDSEQDGAIDHATAVAHLFVPGVK